MNAIQIYINNQLIDLPEDSDIGLRLQRFVQDDYEITQRGGDYSLNITLPITKNNARIFGPKDQFYQFRKFGEIKDYEARIVDSGQILLEGVFRLNSVSDKGYKGDFASINVDWLSKLESIRLTKLGYKDDVATWTVPFRGMNDANYYNENYNQDIVFPDISYNNVPVTDYLFYSYDDVFGPNALDLPNMMPTNNAYWSWRFGASFEDFPPAVKLESILKKISEEIGYEMKGDIFSQDNFDRLILPYVGNGYVWNWGTLASLRLTLINNPITYLTDIQILTAPNSVFSDLYGPNNEFNLQLKRWDTLLDNPSVRTDYVANFNKYGVTAGKQGYVAPIDGKYRISIRTIHRTNLTHNLLMNNEWLNIGQGQIGRSWSNEVLVIVRQNQNGEYVLNPQWEKDLANYLAGINDDFINKPSDVIAYIIPAQYNVINTLPNRKYALGSPIQEWQQEPTVLLSWCVPNPTMTTKNVSNMVDFSIDVQLLKNERVYAYWYSPINIVSFSTNGAANSLYSATNETFSPSFKIDVHCGDTDIDIARNLPDITAKDFITSFIRLFNLNFTVDNSTRTINFRFNNSKKLSKSVVDLTDYIDAETIEFRPVRQPKELLIGYTNDEKDRLLTMPNVNCNNQKKISLDYANVRLTNNNIYTNGVKDVRTSFSATKFVRGRFQTVNVTANPPTFVSTYNDPNGNPFWIGLNYGATNAIDNFYWDIPSIQSLESFNQKRVGDLEYSWDYASRLLYFIGVPQPNQYFLVGAPFDTITQTNFWKKPTACTFAGENSSLFGSGTYPSLRFDHRLYEEMFNNQLEVWKNGYILSAKIYLNSRLWELLQGSQRIVVNGDVFQLMTIEDYDITGNNPSTITLLKLT
jgi:hypothetical protein